MPKSSKTAVIHSVMPGMLALATPQHAASMSLAPDCAKASLSTARRLASATSAPTRSLLMDPLCPLPTILPSATIAARVLVPPPSIPRTTLMIFRFPFYFCGAAPPSRNVPDRMFRLPSVFGGFRPSRCAIHGYRFTLSNGATVLPTRRSGPAAKKLAFISGRRRGSKPCMPRFGG